MFYVLSVIKKVENSAAYFFFLATMIWWWTIFISSYRQTLEIMEGQIM